jgi:hypothetical protein
MDVANIHTTGVLSLRTALALIASIQAANGQFSSH